MRPQPKLFNVVIRQSQLNRKFPMHAALDAYIVCVAILMDECSDILSLVIYEKCCIHSIVPPVNMYQTERDESSSIAYLCAIIDIKHTFSS